MVVTKKDVRTLDAYQLRAVASGRYKGVDSTQTEMKYAKEVLQERGLSAKPKKQSRKDPFEDMFGGSFGGFGGIDL